MRLRRCTPVLLLLPLAWAASPAARADEPAFTLTIKDHRFSPADLSVPANTRVKLTIKNLDATPAEFESRQFKAEKLIPAGREATLTIGPLNPGSYEYFDDYHENESKSRLIAK